MTYEDKGEKTREFYRRQGEARERERILFFIKEIQEMRRKKAAGNNYSQTISFTELELILNEDR